MEYIINSDYKQPISRGIVLNFCYEIKFQPIIESLHFKEHYNALFRLL